MSLPLYLAMTAAEYNLCPQLPPHPAWMACHFSPYSTGLSNFPQNLPPNSMLILNDRTPIAGHDANLIANQLNELAVQLQISSLLLDFQRPDNPETTRLIDTLGKSISLPMGISELYAESKSFPVFLPPPPPNISLEKYLAPWSGREIWLDCALDSMCITVTETGSAYTQQTFSSQNPLHYDHTLFCHYQIETDNHSARFLLHRTFDDLINLLEQAEQLGITKAIGLYQELGPYLFESHESSLTET